MTIELKELISKLEATKEKHEKEVDRLIDQKLKFIIEEYEQWLEDSIFNKYEPGFPVLYAFSQIPEDCWVRRNKNDVAKIFIETLERRGCKAEFIEGGKIKIWWFSPEINKVLDFKYRLLEERFKDKMFIR